jgi:hypothetical protein
MHFVIRRPTLNPISPMQRTSRWAPDWRFNFSTNSCHNIDRFRIRQMPSINYANLLSMRRYPCYLPIGAPGSGKGTLGKVLGTIPGYFHLDCGEVFCALDLRTPIGLHDNRLDDANESVIRKRLETYECETTPILEYYRNKVTVIACDQASH